MSYNNIFKSWLGAGILFDLLVCWMYSFDAWWPIAKSYVLGAFLVIFSFGLIYVFAYVVVSLLSYVSSHIYPIYEYDKEIQRTNPALTQLKKDILKLENQYRKAKALVERIDDLECEEGAYKIRIGHLRESLRQLEDREREMREQQYQEEEKLHQEEEKLQQVKNEVEKQKKELDLDRSHKAKYELDLMHLKCEIRTQEGILENLKEKNSLEKSKEID